MESACSRKWSGQYRGYVVLFITINYPNFAVHPIKLSVDYRNLAVHLVSFIPFVFLNVSGLSFLGELFLLKSENVSG